MFIKKKVLNTDNCSNKVGLLLCGDNVLSRFAIAIASLCSGTSCIKNISVNEKVINLIEQLKQLGVDIKQDGENIIINGKGLYGFQQPRNIIDIKDSKKNLLLMLILVANQDFKTFITGSDDFVLKDFSFIYNYLENINIVFNSDEHLPLLCYGKRGFLQHSSFTVEDCFDKGVLLLSSIFNKKNTVLSDKDLQDETVENILKHFGVDISEKYYETTNFLTRTTKKCKEIVVNKNKTGMLEGKNLEIPANLKDTFYCIIAFLLTNNEEIVIKNVMVNELNDDIIKLLIENGVDLQFRNQRVINEIKVSDLIIKRSELKPLSVSKERTKKVVDYYPFVILLNLLKNNSFKVFNAKYLKEKDKENYLFTLQFAKQLGFELVENKDELEFVAKDNFELPKNNINIVDKLEPTMQLAVLLAGICCDGKIECNCNIKEIKDIFTDFDKMLSKLNLTCNE